MQLPELAALIELAASAPDNAPDVLVASTFLFRSIGAPATGATARQQRSRVPDAVPAAAAANVLTLLLPQLPADVALADVAAVLAPPGLAGFGAEQLVLLDSLLGLVCLLSSGDTAAKLQLLYWTLDKDGTGALTRQELLLALPALQLAAAAARLLLRQASRASLLQEAAQAAAEQRWQLLAGVVQRAFDAADPRGTGVLRPGEQVQQMLFSIAAQLTAVLLGDDSSALLLASPAPSQAAAAVPAAAGRSSSASGAAAAAGAAAPVAVTEAAAAAGGAGSDAETSSDDESSSSSSSSSNDSDSSSSGGSSHGSGKHGPGSLAAKQQQQAQGSQHQQGGSQSLPDGSQQQTQHGQAAAAAARPRPPVSAFSSAAGTPYVAASHQPTSGGPMADVVIVDAEGSCVHYQTPVSEAAQAAVTGRAPANLQGCGLTVYQRGSADNVGGQAATLSPAASLCRQLQLAEAQAQAGGSCVPLSPSDSALDNFTTPAATSAGAAGGGRLSNGSSASASRRRLAAATAVAAGGAPAGGSGIRAGAGGPAVPAVTGPAGAITTTVGSVAATLQRNIAAAILRVLVHCGLCFLLTTVVVLSDAALVAGLHAGAKLPLATAFGVAVGANAALMVVVVSGLLVVRAINQSADSRPLAEMVNGPQAQQLDAILANISAAVMALKSAEPPGPGGPPSRTVSGTYCVSSPGSPGDLEGGQAGVGAAAGLPLGKLRTVWSAVGRMAGFLTPQDAGGELATQPSASLTAASMQAQAMPLLPSMAGLGLRHGGTFMYQPPGAAGAGTQQQQQQQAAPVPQHRVRRAAGAPAPPPPQLAGGRGLDGSGAGGRLAVRDAYPQL